MNRIMVLLGLGALSLSSPAFAKEEAQPWPTVFVSVPVTGKWLASGEVINRVVADRARPSQLETRLQIGRTLARNLTVWAGYVHVVTYNEGRPDGIENQAVEQVNWNVGSLAGIRVAARTRLEQRSIRGADRTAWRVREQIRLAKPVGGGASLVLWVEPFVALNRTSATQTTFDQVRTFAGVALPVTKHAEVELGYLNQHIHRLSGDVTNDVIPIVLNVRF